MHSPESICKQLEEKFHGAVVRTAADASHPHAVIDAGKWPEVARHLRDELGFNMLRCISALDLLADNKLAALYELHAMQAPVNSPDDFYTLQAEIAIQVEVDRDNPHIPSVAQIWPAADWHEREAYDLMGICFDEHPDSVSDADGLHPRRILCPDDWVGYPLRKDYKFPMEYQGIPGTTEYELTSPRH